MAAFEQKEAMRGEADAAAAPPPPAAASTGAPSIQISVDEDMQTTLTDVILDDFDKAKTDRNDRNYGITSKGEELRFDEWFEQIKKLYNGYRQPKTIPWKFCSNRSLRIATAIVDMIHSRLYPAVWNEDLCRWRPGNSVDAPKAERISKFMDWWVRVWAPLRSFYDQWVKYVAGMGDALVETTWEVEEIVTSMQVDVPIAGPDGVQLTETDGKPAVTKQPFVNRVEKTKSDYITKENVYFLKGARDVQRDPVMIKETFLYKQLQDMEKRGICVNVTEKLSKHIIVPEPAGNIAPAEKERLRQIKLRNMPVDVVRWYGHYDVDGSGMNDSVRIYVSEEHRIYLGGVRMRDVTKSGRRPLSFTKYDYYIERPKDLDGEGVLMKVYELAHEIDAIFNQMTDANTLSVLRPFFYDPSGDLDASAITLGPNKGIPVTDPQKNVYFPEMKMNITDLMNAIKMVMEFIERLTAASEYIMGRESDIVGGSGTATRTQAIVQSAEVRFTLPSERLRAGASDILSTHLDLIQLNIPMGFEQKVLGEKGEPIFQQGELNDMGLAGDFTAYLLPDPSMGSKETERQMMGMIYSMLLQNMVVGTDPAKIYELTYEWLKSMGRDEMFIKRILGPRPEQDMIDDPEDENTLMLQGDFKRVMPQITENHMFHIMKHMELQKSPSFLELQKTAPSLTTQISEYNQLHIQQHMEMMAAMMGLMQKQGGGPASGGSGAPSPGQESGPKPEGANGVGGMEAVPGAMGKALDTQRNGKVAGAAGKPTG